MLGVRGQHCSHHSPTHSLTRSLTTFTCLLAYLLTHSLVITFIIRTTIMMMRLCMQRFSRTPVTRMWQSTTAATPTLSPTLSLTHSPISNIGSGIIFNTQKSMIELLFDGILFVKRTFQPSLLRRKRKHGFLVRARTNNGNKTLTNRRVKKRRYICA